MPRIYVAGSKGKNEIILRGREAHYLKNVLRLKKDDKITIFDGDEGEGFIKDISGNNVAINIKNWKKNERRINISITLAQSVLKGEKMDMVIEKAAEIGVVSIIPLITERVIPRYSGKEKKRRWEKIVSEAVRVCGRPVPPKLSPPIALDEFLTLRLLSGRTSSQYESAGLKIVPWEEEKETMLSDLFPCAPTALPCVAQATVVMGPEGGFSKGEISLLRKAGFKTVSLGNLILRSETAAIYTLSCLANFYSKEYD